MKILIIKDVFSSKGWRHVGDIIEIDTKTSNQYIKKGIAVQYKEEKAKIETKEHKAPKKRNTKKSK
jgi:hypothetical protein